jgi:hypothetical protein
MEGGSENPDAGDRGVVGRRAPRARGARMVTDPGARVERLDARDVSRDRPRHAAAGRCRRGDRLAGVDVERTDGRRAEDSPAAGVAGRAAAGAARMRLVAHRDGRGLARAPCGPDRRVAHRTARVDPDRRPAHDDGVGDGLPSLRSRDVACRRAPGLSREAGTSWRDVDVAAPRPRVEAARDHLGGRRHCPRRGCSPPSRR